MMPIAWFAMASPLSIRRVGAEQVDQIRDLSVRAYAKWVPITPRKPRPMTADYSASVLTNQFDFLFEGERLVGLIETVQQDPDLMIVNVAVEPDCQGILCDMRSNLLGVWGLAAHDSTLIS
jgi:hypothetical protein